MAPRQPKFKIIPNPKLLEAGRGYAPEYGNDADLYIAKRAKELDRKLGLVDNTILRGDPKFHTSKMKEILREEEYLISSITSRNLDF